MKVLIATHNPAKFAELKKGLSPLEQKGVEIVSLKDLEIETEPKETGRTFEENALTKAKFYSKLCSLPTISDDGGLGIESLDGEPGVKSRMWLGREASDEELIEYTLERLKDLSKAKRGGYFETAVCFYDPQTGTHFIEKERIRGYFAEKPSPRRIKGYPFRSLFVIDRLNKYYDELTADEHEKVNHRLKAVRRLVQKITTHLLK